jgi:hypothetical protein
MAFETHTPRVYTAERLAVLVAAADKKEAKRKAEQEAADAARHLEFVNWARAHKKVIGGIVEAKGNPFLESLALQLSTNRMLSDKQIAAAVKTLERAEKRKAENAASEFVGEIKQRFEFDAEVIGVYGTEGYYGHTDIVKFKDADGNLFTWFASGYQDLEHGDRITIKGTVKEHDTYRGVKQTVLTRCKFTKFQVMTPDEAASANGAVLTGERVALVYPEERSVPASQIFAWHSDAVANGEVEKHTSDLRQAIADLEDLGHITTTTFQEAVA